MARYSGERNSIRLLGFAEIWGAKAVAFDFHEPFSRLPVCLYSGSRTRLREGLTTGACHDVGTNSAGLLKLSNQPETRAPCSPPFGSACSLRPQVSVSQPGLQGWRHSSCSLSRSFWCSCSLLAMRWGDGRWTQGSGGVGCRSGRRWSRAGASRFGSGPRGMRRWRSTWRGGRGPGADVGRADARGGWLFLRPRDLGRRRDAVPLPARRRGPISRPGLAVPARGPARAVGGDRPRRFPLDRRRLAGPRAPGARSSTRCTSARSPPRGPGGPPPRSARPGRAGHHRAGGHAGRRLPRPVRLGLRRRQPVRPTRGSTARPTTSAVSSTGQLRRGSPSSSTSSTTTSARTATTSRSSRPPTSPSGTRPSGATFNFDGPSAAAGPRVHPGQRRLLDRRVPPRRPAARRDAEDLRHLARPHPGGARPPGPRGGGRRAGPWSSARTSRRRPTWSGRRSRGARPRRALERRLPPRRDGRRHRPARGLLQRLPRHAAGVHLRPPSGATSIRGSGTPGRASAGRSRRPASNPPASSSSSRTTTRSPTRREATGSTG